MQQLAEALQDLYNFDQQLVVIPYLLSSNHEQISQALLLRSHRKLQGVLLLLNFKTKFKTGYISTSLATRGSSWVSKEAKFIKKFDFLGFSRCFSVRIEKTSKNYPKMTKFGSILDIFEDFSILTKKQRLKPRKLNSLMNFASLDTQLDPPTRKTSGMK